MSKGGVGSDLRWRQLLVPVMLLLVTYVLGHTRPVQHASWALWDAIEAASSLRLQGTEHVRIVSINPQDYQQLFRATSPLDPDGLAKLIARVLMGAPKRVYVDIDTSASQFEHLELRIAYHRACMQARKCPDGEFRTANETRNSAGWTPGQPLIGSLTSLSAEVRDKVRWARAVDADTACEDGETAQASFTAAPVLGVNTGKDDVRFGHVAVLASSDGRVRQFPLHLGGQLFWRMAARDIAQTTGLPAVSAPTCRPKFLPALRPGVLTEISASEIISGSQPVDGKIVFLGGGYDRADRFYTADGLIHPGISLLAAVSLANAQGAFSRQSEALEWFSKIALCLLVFYANNRVSNPLRRLGLLLCGFGLFCGLLIVFAFWFGSILPLAALFVSLLLEQAYEGTVHGGHTDSVGVQRVKT